MKRFLAFIIALFLTIPGVASAASTSVQSFEAPLRINLGGTNATSFTSGYVPYFDGTRFVTSPMYTDGTSVGIGTTTLSSLLTVAGTTTTNAIQFNLTPTYTPLEGLMYWNVDEGTANLGMPGGNVNLQVGQEILRRVTNDEATDLANGELVYISGSTGNNLKVKRARANSSTTSHPRTIYMTTEPITAGQKGYVTYWGDVHGLDTDAYTAGDVLWLSATSAGGFTHTRPSAPNYKVKIGKVLKKASGTGGIITMAESWARELSELQDFEYTGSAAAGHWLQYNASGYWTNYDPTLTSPTFVTTKLTGLADGFIPYHSSDSVGLVNSPIITNGTSVAIGTTLSSTCGLRLAHGPANTTSTTLQASPVKISSTSGTYYTIGIDSLPYVSISSGVTDSGYLAGSRYMALRKTAGDAGTLSNLYGHWVTYGHASGVDSTAVTTTAYGIYIAPFYQAGTITNMYDIWINSDTSGGTVTNHWGLYQNSANKNYFAGNIGIGTSPSYPLHVSGDAYLTGYVGIGSAPNTSYKLYVAQTATNATLDGIRVLVGKSVTTNGSYYDYAVNALLNISIGSGITDSGAATSFKTDALRNVSGDAGTLSYLQGTVIQYGHGSSIETSATTTSIRGLAITQYAAKGTITNAYDIYIEAPITGGTVTNSWSIYSANTASNYLAGNLGIGVTPSYPLHIYKSQNNITSAVVQNDNAGTAALASFTAYNDALSTGYVRMIATGAGYTTTGGYVADAGVFEAGDGLSGGISIIARATTGIIRLYTGGYADANERVRITANGNVGFNTTSFGTSAVKVLSFGSGTAPTTAPTDISQLWSEDINAEAGKAGLHMMSESGTNKLVVVGTIIKTDTGDPSQVHEGLMVINTYDNNVKVYADGGWRQITSW